MGTHLPPRVLTGELITCEKVDSLKIIAWPEPLGLHISVLKTLLAPGQASSLLLGPYAAKNQNIGPWGPGPGGEEGHVMRSEPFVNKSLCMVPRAPMGIDTKNFRAVLWQLSHILLGMGDKA